jgi:hypothetical protein
MLFGEKSREMRTVEFESIATNDFVDMVQHLTHAQFLCYLLSVSPFRTVFSLSFFLLFSLSPALMLTFCSFRLGLK